MKHKCLSCNKDFFIKFDEELKHKFKNTFKFSNNGINNFFLLLRKDICPYKYIDDWDKFYDKTSLEKKNSTAT